MPQPLRKVNLSAAPGMREISSMPASPTRWTTLPIAMRDFRRLPKMSRRRRARRWNPCSNAARISAAMQTGVFSGCASAPCLKRATSWTTPCTIRAMLAERCERQRARRHHGQRGIRVWYLPWLSPLAVSPWCSIAAGARRLPKPARRNLLRGKRRWPQRAHAQRRRGSREPTVRPQQNRKCNIGH